MIDGDNDMRYDHDQESLQGIRPSKKKHIYFQQLIFPHACITTEEELDSSFSHQNQNLIISLIKLTGSPTFVQINSFSIIHVHCILLELNNEIKTTFHNTNSSLSLPLSLSLAPPLSLFLSQ